MQPDIDYYNDNLSDKDGYVLNGQHSGQHEAVQQAQILHIARLDEMLPNVYITTNETLVNIPPNLHLRLADGLISLGRLCT